MTALYDISKVLHDNSIGIRVVENNQIVTTDYRTKEVLKEAKVDFYPIYCGMLNPFASGYFSSDINTYHEIRQFCSDSNDHTKVILLVGFTEGLPSVKSGLNQIMKTGKFADVTVPDNIVFVIN